MGWLDSIMGTSGYEPNYSGFDRILAGENRVLQERQDEMMEDPSVARLASPEGRATIFEDTAQRIDTAYRNAMLLGEGNLARSGLSGSSASSLLRARMTKDKVMAVNDASNQADLTHGGFVADLFGRLRGEHRDWTAMKLNTMMGFEAPRANDAASERELAGSLLESAGSSVGNS